MNIFYEESGNFKVAQVVQQNDSNYQAITQHGKRAKIKASHVFLSFEGEQDAFLAAAEEEATQIDIQLLWETSGEAEISAEDLATDYYGHAPSQIELAAILMALYAAPMYFYKKGRGIFKAAPEETLKQALATIERKKAQEAQIDAWAAELKANRLPESIRTELAHILHAPDKQSLAYKAFNKAAEQNKLSFYQLAKQIGGIKSLAEYLHQGFALRHFPQGTTLADIPLPELADYPLAEGVQAFSIDDEATTEIDDALSVQDLGNGVRRLGIHIAAPALAVTADSPIDTIISARQSTVYFPSGKITMLPENWISAFSLDAGGARFAISIYFDVSHDWQVQYAHSAIEKVWVAANLRIGEIEPYCQTPEALAQTPEAFPFQAEMAWLYQLAIEQQKARERYEPDRAPQYDYSISVDNNEHISVSQRQRGAPIDTIVSEMMILANSTWAKMLHDNQIAALFRIQPTGKVRMSIQSEPHIGMGVAHYGWFTSPLRRAADMLNQTQLLSLLSPERAPRYVAGDEALFTALRDFESTYAAYADFQRQMETYWSLVYLEQTAPSELTASLIKDEIVRIEGLPLVSRALGIPMDLPAKTRILLRINELDSEKQHLHLTYLKPIID